MIFAVWRAGWRRVGASPVLVAGVFVLTLLLAMPLAIAMRSLIETHLGSSLAANAAADGVNYDWWQEFTAQATGLGTTFTTSVIGFAASLDSISSVADGRAPAVSVRAAVVAYLAGWLFLSGGILDRYARQRPTRAHAFFGACGVYFFRFLRLGIVAGAGYWFLFGYVHPRLFGDWYAGATRDLAVERTAMLWRGAMYVAFGTVLAGMNLLIDYAKIRAVVEDRRSMLGALAAAFGFILRHPGRTLGLYAVNMLTFLLLAAIWALLAPGAGGAGLSMWVGLLGGQLYVLGRLLLKLQFMASQTALFQRSLAHASYVAAPVPRWPDSPAAESIS